MIIKPILISENYYTDLIKIDESTACYNESWLQKVINDNPHVYPIDNPLDVDLKIISLGREINSGAGYIDILLLTSMAELVVVETKLWKNPEKSRTVLAQVLDYAKEIVNWGYEDLDKAIITAQRNLNCSKALSLSQMIENAFPSINQTDFLEMLCKNMQQGNLKLSIIGDNISPNLILLSDTIESAPGLNFNLSLVEMKLFKFNSELILIPDIVGRTKEVVRGVIKVQYELEQKKPKVDVIYLESENNQKSRSKTDRDTFLSQCSEDVSLILDKWLEQWQNNQDLLIYWGSIGISVKRQIDDKWTTILDIYPTYISMIIQSMADVCKIPTAIYEEYLEKIFIIDRLKSAYSQKKRYIYFNLMCTDDINMLMDSTGDLIDKILKK